MSHHSISTTTAPAAIGPYSQAIQFTGPAPLLYCSGQIPLDPTTGELVAGDTATQARQALTNLAAVLEAGGANLTSVLRTELYLTDMHDFAAVNAVYEEFFSNEVPPARSCIAVAALPKGAAFEIAATAYVITV